MIGKINEDGPEPVSAPAGDRGRRGLKPSSGRIACFTGFWLLSLLAVYAPILLWMAGSDSFDADPDTLFFPVALVLILFWNPDPVLAWCVLGLLWLSLALASWFLCRFKTAWILVPGALFVFALFQAVFIAKLMHGLNGI